MADIIDSLPLAAFADPMTASDIDHHPDRERIWATLLAMADTFQAEIRGYQDDAEKASEDHKQHMEEVEEQHRQEIKEAYASGQADARKDLINVL